MISQPISECVSVGGQPQLADLEQLKSEGVATVVNLRVPGEDTPLTPAAEGALVEKLGLSYHHLPVSLDKLNPAQVEELREILQKSRGRVFVHCGTGQRACSLSLAASGVGADSIQRARELGFPVEDAKLRSFLESLRT